jgi:hypothetical protein
MDKSFVSCDKYLLGKIIDNILVKLNADLEHARKKENEIFNEDFEKHIIRRNKWRFLPNFILDIFFYNNQKSFKIHWIEKYFFSSLYIESGVVSDLISRFRLIKNACLEDSAKDIYLTLDDYKWIKKYKDGELL